jgi:hypothetical protein
VLFDEKKHLTKLCNKPAIANKFVAVLWIGDSIEKTCKYEHHIHSPTLMVITPLFSDILVMYSNKVFDIPCLKSNYYYLINTNRLRPTMACPLLEGTDLVKLDKLKLLKDIVDKWKWMC